MDNQICIDFGTSSTRSAISYHGKVIPLKIAADTSIDNASIPSAILVTSDGEKVLFGHEAILAAGSGVKHLFYEKSPKKWLIDDSVKDNLLDLPVGANRKFTRRNLLEIFIGLTIKQAYSASIKTLKIKEAEAHNFGLRISHPAWNTKSRSKNHLYQSLLETASTLTNQTINWTMTGDQIDSLKFSLNYPKPPRIQDIEVEEPIAAAIPLFGGFPKNKRAIALIIDIGAGTIDLGLFSMVVPDSPSLPPKLKQWIPPVSLVGAGDRIDEALMSIVNIDELSVKNAVQFKNRIRTYKEQLFDRGDLIIGDSIRIKLNDLTKASSLIKMAKGLEKEVKEMLNEATRRLSVQTQTSSHRLDEVFVVFAGGGANIKFLKDAVTQAIRSVPGMKANYDFRQRDIDLGAYSIDASIERMAVALGGAVDVDKWPDSIVKDPTLRGWNWSPKQIF